LSEISNTPQFAVHSPGIDPAVWVAPTATVVGHAFLEAGASVFFGAVIRADLEQISVGAGTNVQDNAVIHADPGYPAVIGQGVSIGHGAVLHGCTVEDHVLIGMNATVLNGAIIGQGSLIAAGALVTEGTAIPPRSLVAGVPGKVRRELTEAESEGVIQNAVTYQALSRAHAKAAADADAKAKRN